VLVVADDADLRARLRSRLEEAGHAAVAGDAPTALALLRLIRPDVVVLDAHPPLDVASFARAYRRLPGPHARLVLLSADAGGPRRARRLGATHVPKPLDVDRLLAAVGGAAAGGVVV
jgi:CheY-like chemotaxis protein